MSLNLPIRRPRLRMFAAALFVLLMAGLGFAQAVHVHDARAGQTSPPSHCSLCVAAHNAAVTTPVSSAPALMLSASLPDLSEPQLQARLQVASSFIRPPPPTL